MRKMNALSIGLSLMIFLQLGIFGDSCTPVQPPKINMVLKYTRGVLLGWSSVPGAKYYKISYKSLNPQLQHSGVAPTSYVTISSVYGLEEATEYEIKLCAFVSCNNRDYQNCTTTRITTRGTAPSGPASNLQVTKSTENSLGLSWSLPLTQHRNGIITGCEACIRLKSNGATLKCQTFNTSVQSYTFDGLRPFTDYVLVVACRNAIGLGPFGSGKQYKTKEGIASAPAIKVIVTQKDSTSLLITPPETPNGVILRYEVKVSRSSGGTGPIGGYTALSKLITVKHLLLVLGGTYYFSVRAVNSAGHGAWSDEVEHQIIPVMGERIVTAETPTEVTACINITLPSLPAVLEEIHIYYSPIGNSPEPEKSAIFSASLQCQRLMQLSAGICYQFSFSVKIVIGDLTLPQSRTVSVQRCLPSIDSPFKLPPRGLLKPTQVCSLYGLHHVTTFDGQPYTVDTAGTYVVVRAKNNFVVKAYLQTCEGVGLKCIRSITFSDLRCGLHVQMTASDCGGTMNITYGTCNHSDVLSWIQGCKRHVVFTHHEVELIWDGYSYLLIKASPKLTNTLSGLCGNYNGEHEDDLNFLRTEKNCIRNTTEDQILCKVKRFTQKWRRETPSNQRTNHTQCSWRVAPVATETCQALMDSSGPFASCFPVLPFTTFHRQCILDTCGEEEDVREARFCSLASEYVARCSECGVNLKLPDHCAPKNTLDCVLEEEVLSKFNFGNLDVASPYTCTTDIKRRKCKSPTLLGEALCRPSRSDILDVKYTCQPLNDKSRKTTEEYLKVPNDFSCDIYK